MDPGSAGLKPNEVLCLVEELYTEYPGEVLRAACRAEIDERDEIGSLIYGEVGFVALSWILKAALSHVKAHDGSPATFYDLGSGSGRMVLSAALLQPSFRKCAGIEIIQGLHSVAGAVLDKYNQMRYSLPESYHDQTIQLVQSDLLQVDWSDASVVLVNSTCFTSHLMMALEERAAELLQFGSVIVTFSSMFKGDCWEVVEQTRRQMSWGPADIFIHRKL